jgi:hypothetical protein
MNAGSLPTAEQLQPAIKAVVQGVDWRDGFDGSGVSEGPNHSTVELWFDTKEQADAAHEAFLDMIDYIDEAGAREAVRALVGTPDYNAWRGEMLAAERVGHIAQVLPLPPQPETVTTTTAPPGSGYRLFQASNLTKTALDGERNGRLAWMPGA